MNLSADKVATNVSSLYEHLLLAWLNTPEWLRFREATEKLACALDSYLSYPRSQNNKVKVHHDSPASHVADKTSIQLLQANQSPSSCLSKLNNDISHKNPYEHLFVAEYALSDPRESIIMCKNCRKDSVALVSSAHVPLGGSVGNYLFIWPIPKHVTMEAALSENQKVISQIQADVPAYHHRALRKKLISKFGRLSHKTSLANLREFYRVVTGDQTASLTTAEEEIDARLREALEMKDPDLILDLRGQNKGHSDKFAVFWEKNESVSQRVICCA